MAARDICFYLILVVFQGGVFFFFLHFLISSFPFVIGSSDGQEGGG
jgi:hypothetical protein